MSFIVIGSLALLSCVGHAVLLRRWTLVLACVCLGTCLVTPLLSTIESVVSIDPRNKATIVSVGISETLNCLAAFAIPAVPSAGLLVFGEIRRARRRASPPR
ncbi:MAG: hypothetical protein HY901_27080 [Deltaproteobacteria bacterium]|nr:hypothetical protein [Deltaproteobacteria bacterium]